jgi:cysteine desulfurase/selenocysteine lyase
MAQLTPAALRALFPATRRASYLNAAAASPIPLPVEQAVREHYQEGVEWGDLGFEAWLKRREEIRRRYARFIHARPDEVAFVPSTSFGFQVVAQVLRQRGVKEVVTLEGEFPSTTLPFLDIGMTLRVVRARPDGSYAPEDVEAAIGRRTGALAVSAVQYASGFRIDLSAVSALCRDRGLLLAVNGAQALGQIPFDVDAQGIDFLCGTSHKWLFAGYGVGLFFARKALLDQAALPMCGWLSVAAPMEMDNLVGAKLSGRGKAPWFTARGTRFRKEASALEGGCVAFGPLFGLGAALELHQQVGRDAKGRQIRALQRQLRGGLRERGFAPNSPDDPARGSGICVFPVAGRADRAVRELGRRGVMVTPRGGGIRVSTHVFNTEEDVEQLFWALQAAGVRPPTGG